MDGEKKQTNNYIVKSDQILNKTGRNKRMNATNVTNK